MLVFLDYKITKEKKEESKSSDFFFCLVFLSSVTATSPH